MPDKIYHFVSPQDPENGIGEVDRAIADRYGNIIDETYFTSSIAYTKEEVDALIEAAQVGVQWGKITGTLSDQTDLQAALDAKQNILSFDDTPTSGSLNPVTSNGIFRANQLLREVAEGKCKSFTASYQLTLSEMQTLAQQGDLTIYDAQGTNVTDSIIDGSHMVFIDGFLNPSLNSQASSIGILTEYVAVGDPLSGSIILDTHSGLNLKTGDIIIVIETDVPDRWYASNNDSLYILETAKIDLSTYVTTNTNQEVSSAKTYRGNNLLRISATGWTTKWAFNFDSSANLALNYLTNNDSSTTHYVFGRTTGFYPATNGGKDLGTSNSRWNHLFIDGALKSGNNSNYGITLPDTTGWTANSEIVGASNPQRITAPKAFFNNTANNTLPLRIQGFENKTWGIEMDKDFGRLHFKFANVAGTNISNVITHYTWDSSAFFPATNNTKDLGTSSNTWKDLYLSGNATFTSGQKVSKIYENANGLNFMTDNNTNLLIGSQNIYAYKNILPSPNGTLDLGSISFKWKDLFISGGLKDGNNANYGYVLPDTTSFTANKTIATIDDISNMATTDTEQTVKARKNVGLTDDQRYKGYIKPITAGMEIGMLDDDGNTQYENPRIKISGYAFQVNTMQPINATTDMGTESSKFRNLYQSGKIYNLLYTVNNGVSDTFIVDGANGQTKSLYTFLPMVSSSSDIGSASLKWRNVHISNDIQKAEETVEFICPQAATLGLTLTTVATRTTILNKTLNITIAFKLTNPTASAISLGNLFDGYIKLDQNVLARIKDMDGITLSAIASSSSNRRPIIGKGSYQHDNGYPSEGWVYLNSLSMVHWHLEDNVSSTRFHIGFRSGPSIGANVNINFVVSIEIPLDL